MNLVQTNFPASQYIQEEHPKVQIYLHHTAGNASGEQVFAGWATNPERIATCVSISGKGTNCVDGQIVQGFSSKYWAYHLGLKESTFNKYGVPYQSLDKISIGIEICNWGQLRKVGSKYFNYVNRVVPEDEMIQLETPYKGFEYFHNYTDAQIESVKDLLLLWKDRYGINLEYREDIWDVTPRALKGENGVFTHNSVRTDKVDVYPHPKLIAMLKSL
jgi:N-acetyl-anhydromuramyl-L-alanine amidase AmpD